MVFKKGGKNLRQIRTNTFAEALVAQRRGWFSVATLREPYRAEGKKTMGMELAEQLGWRLPDAIIYPAGGGTGIVGALTSLFQVQGQNGLATDLPNNGTGIFTGPACSRCYLSSPWHSWLESAKPDRSEIWLQTGIS